GFHWQDILPVFPVFVLQQNGDGRANGFGVADAGKNVAGVLFNFHAPAPAKALLPPPQLTVNERLVYLQSRRQPRQEGDQGFAMRFTSGKVAQHKGVVRKQSFYLSGAAIKKASSARLFCSGWGLDQFRD